MATSAARMIENRYELGQVIGRGAMGEVRAGHDTRLQREIAVKLLRPDLAADEDVRSRFRAEARAAARLAHPGIVTIYDTGEWEGLPFIVMERLPGVTLAEELTNGPLSTERAREIALDMLSALECAHGLGVIHRDVKPGNILIAPDGRAKLADFGIAKSTEATADHTQTGFIVGTPAYLAPERLEGHAASPRSDLYSLGVVLYEALTGERAFRGDTPLALVHAIHASVPPPLRDCLPGADVRLTTMVDAAMAKSPDDRPASASELLAVLEGRALPQDSAETVAVARPVEPGGETIQLARHDEPETGAASAPLAEARSWWSERPLEQRRWALAIAAILVAIIVIQALRGGPEGAPQDAGSPSTTVASTPPAAGSLPAPLQDALDDLQTSVEP